MTPNDRTSQPKISLSCCAFATFLFGSFLSPAWAGERGSFAQHVAGTFLSVQENQAQILQVNQDGNLSFIFSEQFRGGTLNDPFSDTLGSWKKTGKRRITSTALDITFESVDGAFVGVAPTTYTITFDNKFRKAHVTCEGAIFPPGVDPFDPEAEPIPASEFDCGDEGLDFYRIPLPGTKHHHNDD